MCWFNEDVWWYINHVKLIKIDVGMCFRLCFHNGIESGASMEFKSDSGCKKLKINIVQSFQLNVNLVTTLFCSKKIGKMEVQSIILNVQSISCLGIFKSS